MMHIFPLTKAGKSVGQPSSQRAWGAVEHVPVLGKKAAICPCAAWLGGPLALGPGLAASLALSWDRGVAPGAPSLLKGGN